MQDEDGIPNMAVEPSMEEKQIEMRTIQRDGRVDLPDDWLEAFGMDHGENIHLIADPDDESITIKVANPENVL